MIYLRIVDSQELMEWFDDFIKGCGAVVRKGYDQSSRSCEGLVFGIMNSLRMDAGTVVVAIDEERKLHAFVAAFFMKDHKDPYVEIVAFWTRPGEMDLGFELQKEIELWAVEQGASAILTWLIRKSRRDSRHEERFPGEHFYNRLHKFIGYQPVGTLLEKRLK